MSFDLNIPKSFNSVQVDQFLTHQLLEINGELVDVGIGKPAQKGKIMYELGNIILIEYFVTDFKVTF